MNAYGSGCIDPHCLDLGTSWRWVVSFTPLPLYPRGKSPQYPLDRRLGGPQSQSGRLGELRPLGRPARSQSLYRLSYQGSNLSWQPCQNPRVDMRHIYIRGESGVYHWTLAGADADWGGGSLHPNRLRHGGSAGTVPCTCSRQTQQSELG
jgi:hypothetical protein